MKIGCIGLGRMKRVSLLLLGCVLALAVPAQAKLLVAVSIAPQAYFLKQIAGDRAEPLVMEAVAAAKDEGISRRALLARLIAIPGVYVPAFFEVGPDGAVHPLLPGYERVEKAIVPDLDTAPFPTRQVVPFAQAVHDRLAVEIARGCTRGCRFCHGLPQALSVHLRRHALCLCAAWRTGHGARFRPEGRVRLLVQAAGHGRGRGPLQHLPLRRTA